jgi:mannose-1-phosphate guanylyltransferase
MNVKVSAPQARCCIVVAYDERSERMTHGSQQWPLDSQEAAIVKKGFLRQASLRARRIASPANVLVSAREDDRSVWTSPFWFTQPANRFISGRGVPTSMSTAAAVLSVAARAPFCLVTILPSDFWVARESVLADAIDKALTSLQQTPGTVATLGMSDTHPGTDEDYLIVGPASSQTGAAIQAKANRPGPAAARQLSREGALVASGILLGHAQAFAARIQKYWSHLARELANTVRSDHCPEMEHRLPADAYQHLSRSVMSSIRLSPPAFPMRAFRVQGSGWCSRKHSNQMQPEPVPDLRESSDWLNCRRSEHPS